MTQSTTSTYRPDIDGLRAIAVLAVVFFHLGLGPFHGGFVGVDVFFVISGYLITAILLRDLDQGRYSIARFYERRIRRIFPALVAVLLVTVALATVLLVPRDLRSFSQSLAATAAFLSNAFFFRSSGYFSPVAESAPLLHTWSLAVEEQFYIVFPLLLRALYGLGRRRLGTVLAALALVSFLAGIWWLPRAPNAAFYLLPFRAWELLLGALLALGALPVLGSRPAREALAALGVALVLGSAAALSHETPFPGYHALFPTVGAALLIYTGDGNAGPTRVAAMLSSRLLVGIGLVSYSLYLWHWPVLVLAKSAVARPLESGELWALALVSGLIAAVSWRLVEQPFRRPGAVFERRRLFLAAGLTTAAIGGLGLAGHLGGGFPSRLATPARLLAEGVSDRDERWLRCSNQPLDEIRFAGLCTIGPRPSAPTSFVVWGDSHAEALLPVFDRLAQRHGVMGRYAGRYHCPPLVGVARKDAAASACETFSRLVLDALVKNRVRTVFMITRWNLLLNGRQRYEATVAREREPRLADAQTVALGLEENHAVLRRALARTIEALREAGVEPWLVGEVPPAGVDPPRTLARWAQLGRDLRLLDPPAAVHQRREALLRAIVEPFAARGELQLLFPGRLLCDASRCRLVEAGRALYRDDDHLSRTGAFRLEPLFAAAFGAIARAGSLVPQEQTRPRGGATAGATSWESRPRRQEDPGAQRAGVAVRHEL